ncbi:hypothetical protein GQ55_4G337000 [Panicum hallii var. hallii]|uniref:Uncharacterized protein n=1 Tax=Panicum hallii var. hallii TaxID=1504633 RepID=A0A2T7E2X2_9POAL|nr:hypothetical protein GQ55_4G337000 [Panicum hallii var. hallii]
MHTFFRFLVRLRIAAQGAAAAAARRPVSARAVKVLKTTLVKAWMLAIFNMSLVMPLAAAAMAAWYASSLARCLPAPAFALCAGAALAFAAHSAWPVVLILKAGGGQVHGEVAVYYWLFLGLMRTSPAPSPGMTS